MYLPNGIWKICGILNDMGGKQEIQMQGQLGEMGLIVAAHGSREMKTTREIVSLAAHIQEKKKSTFSKVRAGFLEFGSPKIGDVIEDFIREGIGFIVVFPFFIASGTHILGDIPSLIQEFQEKYSHIQFLVTHHLVECQGIEDLILYQIEKDLALFHPVEQL